MFFATMFNANEKSISDTNTQNEKLSAEGKPLLPIPIFTGSMNQRGEKAHSYIKAHAVEAWQVEITGEVKARCTITFNAAKQYLVQKAIDENNLGELERVSKWPDFNGYAYVTACTEKSDMGFQPVSGWIMKPKADSNDSEKQDYIRLDIGQKTAAQVAA